MTDEPSGEPNAEPRVEQSTHEPPIRVFLVDDSPVALLLLQRLVRSSSSLQVVGTARNGREALALIPSAQPQIIVTDYHMPEVDGLGLVKEVMDKFPCPILVVSSLVEAGAQEAFALLEAGAVDIFPKPKGLESFEHDAEALIQKIQIVAGVRVISRRASPQVLAPASSTSPARAFLSSTASPSTWDRRAGAPARVAQSPEMPVVAPGILGTRSSDALPTPLVRRGFTGRVISAVTIPRRAEGVHLIAIGASTGGPQALQEVLSSLPLDFPCPILCVQHISVGFLPGMVEWLARSCRVVVRTAIGGDRAVPGTVYFAPEGKHLEIDARGRLALSTAPPVDGHRPSASVLFESVARHVGAHALGVLLTGMGSDGASGLLAMARAGAATIAQDESTSVVFGMPRQAIEMGAAQYVLPLGEVALALDRLAVPSAMMAAGIVKPPLSKDS